MKKILVCQHVAHEQLGTLDPLFRREGFRIRYINFGRHPHAQPSLEGYDGLVVLGGPMNVDETEKYPYLAHEVELIRKAIKNNQPVLGICLGAQLIAKALGGEVTKNRVKEIGWYDVSLTDEGRNDPFFADFLPTEKLFQWHGDTFSIPKGAVHLAGADLCDTQAFRYGTNIYGLQFHLEVDEPTIERWLQVPANKKEIDEEKEGINIEKIREETPLYIARLKELCAKSFEKFLPLFGPRKRIKRLDSR